MTHILIVYETMGMGHQRAAGILEDILASDGVEIIKVSGSQALGTGEIQSVVKLWNFFIRKNWLRTADFLLNFAARLLVLPVGDAIRITRGFSVFDSFKPDLIICTADMYGRALGTYAAHRGIPYFIFITDIAIFLDLVNPRAVHLCYFDETIAAIRSYDFSRPYFSAELSPATPWPRKLGYVLRFLFDYGVTGMVHSMYRNIVPGQPSLNRARARAIGPLAERKHFHAGNPAELKGRHGIPEGIDSVLLASGSLGGEFVTDIVRWIHDRYDRPLNLLVMCGTDRKAFEAISRFKNTNPGLNLLPFAFTTEFEDFLELADCAVIRPSAGIFIESLLHKTPVVASQLAPANDRGTLAMMEKYKLGRVFRHKKDLIPALREVLEQKDQYRARIADLLKIYPETWNEKAALIRGMILGASDLSGDDDKHASD
jgi:UDP-N-acetylglucosamine:LPS N-acetylglucosamine transferase